MEEYLEKYDSLDKIIIYNFTISMGGIGDCIKFFMFLLDICIKNNYKLYYLIENIYIEKYIRLKYNKMYILKENISDMNAINDFNSIFNINSNIYNIVNPFILYASFNYDSIKIKIEDIFEFTNEIKNNVKYILQSDISNYISIHLRLGDKYLETDTNYVHCPTDERHYFKERIDDYIQQNLDKTILFICDNKQFKHTLKEQYNNIIITSADIGHTGLSNTTEKQVLDGITEFYLLTNSNIIIAASYSGFSIIASKFKNIPIMCLY
jgi:hypothetical protein